MFRLLVILLVTFISCNVMASSFGEVAQNLYEPVSFVIRLLRAVSVLAGSGLMLGSIFKYIEYRRNPVQVRLSMVIFMLIFGIALIILGFVPMSALEAL